MEFETHPLTTDRWGDLEALFGKNGAWGGCWCMWWKWTAKEFDEHKGDSNRAALRAACSERPPGLLGYIDGVVCGWVAIEPKEAYPRLLRSRTLTPVDEQPVWSVTCFYIATKARRRGVSATLLQAAVDWAARNGATIVEGYPSLSNPHDWMGLPTTYERCGFERVSAPRGKRVIMRRRLQRPPEA